MRIIKRPGLGSGLGPGPGFFFQTRARVPGQHQNLGPAVHPNYGAGGSPKTRPSSNFIFILAKNIEAERKNLLRMDPLSWSKFGHFFRLKFFSMRIFVLGRIIIESRHTTSPISSYQSNFGDRKSKGVDIAWIIFKFDFKIYL